MEAPQDPHGVEASPQPPEPPAQRRRGRTRRPRGDTMLPPRQRRRFAVETVFMRLVATAGIVGIGVALSAILVSSDVAGWITGLVVSLVTVVLAAVLWSSRQL